MQKQRLKNNYDSNELKRSHTTIPGSGSQSVNLRKNNYLIITDWIAAICIITSLFAWEWYIGVPGLYLPLSIPLMLVMVIWMALVQGFWYRRYKPHAFTLSLNIWYGIILWILFCCIIFRTPTLKVSTQLRDTVVPFILGLIAVGLYSQRPRAVQKLLSLIALGILARGIDFTVHRVLVDGIIWAPELNGKFTTEIVNGYTCMGTYSAVETVICIGFVFDRSNSKMKRLLAVLGATSGLILNIICANRTSLLILCIGPLIYAILKSFSFRVLKISTFFVIGVLVIFALFPRELANLLPDLTPNRSFTFLGKNDPLFGFKTRLLDWELILGRSDIIEIITGKQWDEVFSITKRLAHPHNIFLWMQIMGGIFANLTFGIGTFLVFKVLYAKFKCAKSGSDLLFAFQIIWIGLILVAVLITNSWVNGIPLLLGLWWGIAVVMPSRRCKSEESYKWV